MSLERLRNRVSLHIHHFTIETQERDDLVKEENYTLMIKIIMSAQISVRGQVWKFPRDSVLP